MYLLRSFRHDDLLISSGVKVHYRQTSRQPLTNFGYLPSQAFRQYTLTRLVICSNRYANMLLWGRSQYRPRERPINACELRNINYDDTMQCHTKHDGDKEVIQATIHRRFQCTFRRQSSYVCRSAHHVRCLKYLQGLCKGRPRARRCLLRNGCHRTKRPLL